MVTGNAASTQKGGMTQTLKSLTHSIIDGQPFGAIVKPCNTPQAVRPSGVLLHAAKTVDGWRLPIDALATTWYAMSVNRL